MKTKLILILLTFFLANCSKKYSNDPLLIPPSYGQLPNSNDLENDDENSSDQDLQELKDLLLRNP